MILAFDIGGTTIKPGLAYGPDRIVARDPVPTPAHDLDALIAMLAGEVAATPERLQGLAVSICAVTDPSTGHALCANIPALDRIDLTETLASRLGLPVVVGNDADCFALAEAVTGAGRGHEVVFGIILGTGIGGGLVVREDLINRDGGFAGEWGHGTIVGTEIGDPPRHIAHLDCGCGRKGCVDTIGGARGIERLHRQLWGDALDSRALLARWHEGEARAGETVAAWLGLVADPLALVINVTGATAVPAGGGLMQDRELCAALDRAVRSRTLRSFSAPLVVPAHQTLAPGLTGAAILGFRKFGAPS